MTVYAPPAEIAVPDLMDFLSDGFDHEGYSRAEEEYLAKLSAWARENGEPHRLAGEVVSAPFADGRAVYVVAKLEGRIALIHAPLGDAWRNGDFEAAASVAYLDKVLKEQKARAALFASRQTQTV